MSQVYENIFRDALKDFRVLEDGVISGYCNSLEEGDRVTPRKRLRIMDTRKSNCPVTLNMKCIRVYPDYCMHSATEHRDTKAKVLASLQKDLALPCPPKSYLRFYLTASPQVHTHMLLKVLKQSYCRYHSRSNYCYWNTSNVY
ncbi:uncharacterized protein LOC126272191 [Schistocerca gregaria]|uniref:uncharacterized protein LOC126272191 n=1 Tax=Schistocerca gregaria TaxID=7010 RepID=UPI00211DACC4|nr:uncharacterized protein LOC126272191 [Schistocerca gregaria]